jgi:hypothetical protein
MPDVAWSDGLGPRRRPAGGWCTKVDAYSACREFDVERAQSVTAAEEVGAVTLSTVHRIAVHVLARRRFEVSGRFGLRASPGGFATPAFGDGPEVIRVAGPYLVRETGATSASVPIAGSTLRELAVFAKTDIDAPFSCGDDTPGSGETDAPLVADPEKLTLIADWYALGWAALDVVVTSLPGAAEPATIQLWPEHLDAATNVDLGRDRRVNLGFSPGDSFEAQPYAYVGPWGTERPGDPAYWNAPFGAVLRRADLDPSINMVSACIEFIQTGISCISEEGG